MEIFRNIYDWEAPEEGCAIALGRFDGVHIAHRALLQRAVGHAGFHDLVPVCFGFQEGTYPGAKERGQLTTSEEKSLILEGIGIQVLLHPEFAKPLIDMTAGEFLEELLIDRWHAKLIVAGYDFHFGKDRGGDTEFLEKEGTRLGAEVDIFPPFAIDGIPVKATNIRSLIGEGAIREANALLGRPYSIHARSRGGRQFGRSIGFPTVNFTFPPEKVKPEMGVYAVRMHTDEHGASSTTLDRLTLGGVANYGLRPTVEPDSTEVLLEVHILGPHTDALTPGDIPPDTLFEIEFLDFIREEQRFDSVEDLKKQIADDCRKARLVPGIRELISQ
jgi:riboflavin kinase/FMN adenylyltransferase